MADKINRRDFDFSVKTSALGSLYLAYEREKDVNRTFSFATCELHESAWDWYGPALDKFDAEFLRFKNGTKAMNSEQRKEAEKQLFDAIKKTLYEKKAKHEQEHGRPYSPVTVNMYVRIMKTFFKWLVAEEVLKNDFADEFNSKLMMAEPKKSRTIFYPSQLEKYIKYKPPQKSRNQNRAWVGGLLIFDVGLRLDELLDLRVNDFEWADSLVCVNHGKGDKQRRMPMDAGTVAPLLKYRTRFINPDLKNPYFFGTRNGSRTRDDNFRRDLQIVLRKAGITTDNDAIRLTPHCMRHTAATATLINTGDIYKVKRMMGHERIDTTEVYLHLADELMGRREENSSTLSSGGKFRQLNRPA